MAHFLGWSPDRATVGKRALLVQGSWATTCHSIQAINSASARPAVAKSDDTADRNGRVPLEPEPHSAASGLEHRDDQQGLAPVGVADHDYFLALTRQNQHGSTSALVKGAPPEPGTRQG